GRCKSLRETEVEHLRTACREKDVRGFDVAMDDAGRMGGAERVRKRKANVDEHSQLQRSAREPVMERLAFKQLHHEVVGANVVQRANVRMVQGRCRVHLSGEAIAETLGGNLDCHVAPHPRIVGAVHFAHAARADGRDDFIRTKASSGREGHVSDEAKSLTDLKADRECITAHPEVGGLPESVFPQAAAFTSSCPLDKKWASRTLAPNGLVGSVQSAPVRSSPIRKVARERWVAVGFPDGVMT